ncbi:MAG: hypothetical protein WB611_04520 [Stellaceae bacterium]
MGNRFNYHCPTCGSADEIEICAFVSIRLTDDRAAIAEEVQDLDGSCWSADNDAGCGACGYEGAVRDFSPLPPGVVSLNDYRRRR